MYSGREGCDVGLLALRLGIGGMLLGLHGWARLVKAFVPQSRSLVFPRTVWSS